MQRLRKITAILRFAAYQLVRLAGNMNHIRQTGKEKSKMKAAMKRIFPVSLIILITVTALIFISMGSAETSFPSPAAGAVSVVRSGEIHQIILNKTSATLTRTLTKPKPTLQLKAAVVAATGSSAPEITFTWKSSDTTIASVDQNGKVTGKKAGTVTITCQVANDSGIKATCKITVKNKPVTALTLNKKSATLTRTAVKRNPTLQLKVTVTPDDAAVQSVSWKSSNTSVATVDSSGKVTALRSGTTRITCSSRDGSNVRAYCSVTVKNRKVSQITLNKKSATVKKGRKLQLKVTAITPADAVNQNVTWSSSNTSIATVDENGKVTAKKAGGCLITCTAADGSKVHTGCKIIVE